MQEEIIESMGSCLDNVISETLAKLPKARLQNRQEEAMVDSYKKVSMLLSIFINTKILNTYVLLASTKTNYKDSSILKAFKDLVKQIKDLSSICDRYTHVDGKLSSLEITRSEK